MFRAVVELLIDIKEKRLHKKRVRRMEEFDINFEDILSSPLLHYDTKKYLIDNRFNMLVSYVYETDNKIFIEEMFRDKQNTRHITLSVEVFRKFYFAGNDFKIIRDKVEPLLPYSPSFEYRYKGDMHEYKIRATVAIIIAVFSKLDHKYGMQVADRFIIDREKELSAGFLHSDILSFDALEKNFKCSDILEYACIKSYD